MSLTILGIAKTGSQSISKADLAAGNSSDLRLGRRQFSSCDRIGEAARPVRPVAKRFIRRLAAAAQADRGTPGKSERSPFRIDNLKVPFDPNRPVMVHYDFRRRHFLS
jgi:hypothetical protein